MPNPPNNENFIYLTYCAAIGIFALLKLYLRFYRRKVFFYTISICLFWNRIINPALLVLFENKIINSFEPTLSGIV